MVTNCTHLSYGKTGYFSNIVIDYLNQNSVLQSFYKHPANIEGVKKSVQERQQFQQRRDVLVKELNDQYFNLFLVKKVSENIISLSDPNTFTITTAHQPNIFTGPVYFIYKILHTIKLAETLSTQLPEYKFIPVYYMGSEDADLDELGSISIEEVIYT